MKKHLLLWTGTLLLILFALVQQAQAQGSTKECNKSQPRPITGEQHPCPGDTETYCIENDRGYTSFVWDVPRAKAGDPPTGWVILSGQGTNCVTVLVGQKSGTMKVKVTDPQCGTKVATLPVKPGKEFEVTISGPPTTCINVPQTYTAALKKRNGSGGTSEGNLKGDFKYTWTVPTGWTIIDGQGSDKLKVNPGTTDGEVSVVVTRTNVSTGNDNNGTGVGGVKTYCNNAADAINVVTYENCNIPCTTPDLAVTASPTVCNVSTFTFDIGDKQEGVTYSFAFPEGFIPQTNDAGEVIVDEDGEVIVSVAVDEEDLNEPQTITVTATNQCDTDTESVNVIVTDCNPGNPLPVTLTRFGGVFNNAGVTLNWETATEINNERFEVERSANGIDFLKIGEVQGNGNSSVALKYSFTDKQPLAGTLYYRLKQVDYDGAYEYSKVISVESKAVSTGTFKVSLFPNPAQGSQVSARFEGLPQNAGEVTLRVVDMSGRVLHTATLPAGSQEVNLGLGSLGLRQGMYLVSLSAGGQNAVQRLVIQ